MSEFPHCSLTPKGLYNTGLSSVLEFNVIGTQTQNSLFLKGKYDVAHLLK